MKIRTPLAAVAIAGTVVIAGTAGVAFAQDDAPPGDGAARREFVCANLEQIQQLQLDRAALVEDRLALLQEARVAAEQDGNAEAVERIGRRIERATTHQSRVTERQGKLAAFAAENCAS